MIEDVDRIQQSYEKQLSNLRKKLLNGRVRGFVAIVIDDRGPEMFTSSPQISFTELAGVLEWAKSLVMNDILMNTGDLPPLEDIDVPDAGGAGEAPEDPESDVPIPITKARGQEPGGSDDPGGGGPDARPE